MIKILTNEDLKNLSPEDKAFLEGYCVATDSAASLLYNEEVREALEVSLLHWLETDKMEYLTQMVEAEQE